MSGTADTTTVPASKTATTTLWTPKWLRWDPDANNELSWGLCSLFGFVAAFSVANLYYTHPILNVLAVDFGVSDERASLIPTMLQSGYAAGLLLVIPLGDITKRRPLVLGIMFATALLWLGATLTPSFNAFLGLSFIIGILTCTPQFMFPLSIQYAPARHRATMTSVVMSGLVFGILVARLLSGIITQYTSWRAVYWLSFGLQLAMLAVLFFTMPDYPVLRPGTSYPQILLKIVTIPFHHPLLIQQSLIAFLLMAMYTSFWTTVTFQLADIFHLSTLVIGLFALIGISPIVLNPIVSHFMIARIHPSGSLIISHLVTLTGVLIGTFVGNFSLAGPVIWAFVGDLGMNTVVVSNRTAIANVDRKAQNAVNSFYMVFSFCGQLSGTAAGNSLYAKGGWLYSGGLSIAFVGVSLLFVLVRGPHEKGWIGWGGGWDVRNQEIGEKPTNPQLRDPQNIAADLEIGGETGGGEKAAAASDQSTDPAAESTEETKL